MRNNTRVTIAIPTYNRAELLEKSLKSVLEQDYPDFRVLVIDNASTDGTYEVVNSFSNQRIKYICNETNVGMFRNWNRAIALNSSPYLCIFSDDDIMLQGFIRISVEELEKNPSAAFSFTKAGGIDIHDAPLALPGDMPYDSVIKGLEYLHRIVNGSNWIIKPASVMMRSSALRKVGPFDVPHAKHSEDFNLYLRLAAHFDIVFIPNVLCNVRIHAAQEYQVHFSDSGGTGHLATMAERTDAVAYLLQSVRAEDESYRQWLAERLLNISMRRSELTQQLIPGLNLSWADRIEIAREEIAALIPPDDTFILVDEDKWGSDIVLDRTIIPFLERDKRYWGPPQDSATAIRELKRLMKLNVSFILFGWPAFWWLDYYNTFRDYLNSNYPCILSNSRLVVFDLRNRVRT